MGFKEFCNESDWRDNLSVKVKITDNVQEELENVYSGFILEKGIEIYDIGMNGPVEEIKKLIRSIKSDYTKQHYSLQNMNKKQEMINWSIVVSKILGMSEEDLGDGPKIND